MQENYKVVLLLSGGIDSTVLLYWLLNKEYDVYPMIVNYGQTTFQAEYKSVIEILENLDTRKLLIINIPEVSVLGSGTLIGEYPENITSDCEWYNTEFFPNRNLLLLTLATSYAYSIESTNVAIGVVGDSYKDTSLSFLNNFNECITNSLKEINIIAPFADKQRELVVREIVNLNVPIHKTFSCNTLSERHCQLCNSCREREEAFLLMDSILK